MRYPIIGLIAFCGLVAVVFLFVVLWANPRRLVNQAFAGTFLFFTLWTGCICMIFLQQKNGFAAQLPWLRANTVLAAWVPLGFWLIKEGIVRQSHVGITRRLIPWIILGLFLSLLSFSPSTFLPPSAPNGPPGRGATYFLYIAVEVMAYFVVIGQIIQVLRSASGIRRIELQLLGLLFAGLMLLASILNGLGSYFSLLIIKLAVFPVFIVGAAICAWGLCVYRIFNARQILLGVAHRTLGVVTFLGGTMLLNAPLSEILAANASLAVSSLIAGTIALWTDRQLHRLLDVGGKRLLARMRAQITGIARIEPHTGALVKRLEAYLGEWTAAESVGLYYSDQADLPLMFQRFSDLYACDFMRERGWATPESLRRQSGFDQLETFQTTAVGLLVAVAGSHGQPSLFIAFGRKRDGSPFTHPEIERLQNVAELMDNILTRSRLTEQAALQARMEHLAMLSRGLAHDLKNLLTPVSSFLVHTDGRFAPDTPEAEVHAAARRSVRIMTDYVREALFFSERLAPKLETLSVSRLFQAACETIQSRAAHRGVSVALEAHLPEPMVGDAVLLQRLLANLLANAIDASSAGQRVTLTARAARPGWVHFLVTDQGCGIAPEHLNRIFEPYFTTKEFGDDVRGFGLGLTIAQKIAQLHRGSISVQSQLGHGTTFTVELPVTQPSGSGAARALADASLS